MAPPHQTGSPQKSQPGAINDSCTIPATAPGSLAALKLMDNRLTHFASTDHASGLDWESETEGTTAIIPSIGFRPARMSDKDWGEDDLDGGYHSTSIIGDEPPPVGEEQIEGAQDTPYTA